MAGYGGLGGLGGFSFPTRRAMGASPNSVAVQSDPEFTSDWERRIASTPQFIAAPGGTQLVNGADGYNSGTASPFMADANRAIDQNFFSGYDTSEPWALAALQATADAARGFGVSINPGQQENGASFGIGANSYTDAGGAYSSQMGASHLAYPQGTSTTQIENPLYRQMVDNFASAKAQRSENQTRQQQTYDGAFMGNGAVGGVMPSNYADANFGQITGQKTGGLGGLGGTDLTAVDQTQQTGAYMGGGGAYNPNPFSAGSFKSQNPWGGF